MADFASVFTNTMAVSGSVATGANVMPTAPESNPFSGMLNNGGLAGQIYGLQVVVNAYVPQDRMGYLRFIYQANGLRRKKTSNG